MDVTKQKTIDEARRYVESHFPKEGLWGVVNYAGYTRTGYVEWVSNEIYEKVIFPYSLRCIPQKLR